MPGSNQFLPFATGSGANVLTPADYAALTSLVASGFTSGIAPSQQVNTPLRQSSFVASAIAQAIADQLGVAVNDDGVIANLENQFLNLFQANKYQMAVAAGTADALTGAFTPAIAALTNGMTLHVRAGSANATTTPTFKADSTTAYAIVKGNGLALAVGDIAGAGHWLTLQWDSTLGKWVLLNPATGITGQYGRLSGVLTPTTSTTLTVAQLGSLVVFNGSTSGQTLTLPPVATCPAGTLFDIQNTASTSVTIKANAAEQINNLNIGVGSSGSNTLVLASGDSTTIVSLSGGWYEQQPSRAATVSAFGSSAQTWQNMTGSRALGTTYTNSTGRSICIHVNATATSPTSMYLTVAGITNNIAQGWATGSITGGSGIIPAGATYSVASTGLTLTGWNELR